MPALTGKVVKGSLREGTVFHSISGMFALRQGKWKLVFGRGAGGRGGKGKPGDPPGQLYDMSVDPYEKNNVFEKHPEIVREMTELMDNYVKRGRSTPGIEQEYVKPVKYLPDDFSVKIRCSG